MTFTPPTNSLYTVRQDERNMGMLIWGLNFFFPLIAPIIFLVTQKQPYLQETSKEVLNFSISYVIYSLIISLLAIVVIGFFLAPILFVADIVFTVLGVIAANNGTLYRVPAIFRFIK